MEGKNGVLTEKTRVYLLSQGDYAMEKYTGWTYRFVAEGQDIKASAATTSGLNFAKALADAKGAPVPGFAVFELKASDGKYKLRLVSFEPSKG